MMMYEGLFLTGEKDSSTDFCEACHYVRFVERGTLNTHVGQLFLRMFYPVKAVWKSMGELRSGNYQDD